MKARMGTWEEWVDRAEDDELSIRAILKDGAPSTACFLSQQMAEKCLKALLVCHGTPFPKVHDLLVLETLLVDSVPSAHQIHECLNMLNGYYIEARYPGDYPEFTPEEARDAFAAAGKVKEFVLQMIHK